MVQNAKYTTNAEYTIHVNHPKKTLKGVFATSQEELSRLSPPAQMVLGTVRREAGPHERQPKALRTKLAQGAPSGLSPLRSDGSCDGQAGGWT